MLRKSLKSAQLSPRVRRVALVAGAVAAMTFPLALPAFAEEPSPSPSTDAPAPTSSLEDTTTLEKTPGEIPSDQRDPGDPPTEQPLVEEVIGHLTVSPLQVYPGEKVRVTGQCALWGYGPTEISLWLTTELGESDLAEFSTVAFDERTGLVDTEVTLSKSSRPGKYEIVWMCSEYDMVYAGSGDDRQTFTVLGTTKPPTSRPPTTSKPPKLPDERGFNLIDPREETTAGAPAELAQTGSDAQSGALSALGGLFAAGGAAATLGALRRRSRAAKA